MKTIELTGKFYRYRPFNGLVYVEPENIREAGAEQEEYVLGYNIDEDGSFGEEQFFSARLLVDAKLQNPKIKVSLVVDDNQQEGEGI